MLCPIGQSNEKPPLQALAKWWEYVTLFIPAACVLFAGNLILENRSIGRLARRLLAFGICIFLVVPASVKLSDLIDNTYHAQIEMTLEEAKKLAEDKTYGRIPLTTV